jgi:pyridoxine 5-phosphate synthase
VLFLQYKCENALGLGCFDYKKVNMRTKLSVNINKVATIRNARGGNNPDIIKVAKDCEAFGADGITVHPRPDERHIRRADVPALQAVLRTEFNIEGYPSRDFLDLVLRVRPSQVTLVPDKPEQLTSNSGWDTEKEQLFLRDVLNELREAGIRSSIFIDADVRMAEFAAEAGADRVELYTGPYAHGYATDRDAAIAPFLETAKRVRQLGIGLNAGHDLSLENLKFFTDVIPWVDEVSIGHALICDALYMGLEATIAAYKDCLKK